MKLLFADNFPDNYLEELRALGHDCQFQPSLTAAELPEHISGIEALIVRSTRVTAETVSASDSLSLIVRAGAGTNTIDKQAAADAGIYVCNVPGRNAVAVAELTIGLLLAVDRRIPQSVIDLRAGRWNKKEYSRADGVFGKTMGIVGLGNIGLAVAERASAFGMKVLALQRPGRSAASLSRIDALGLELVDGLPQLVAASDVLSLHVPADSSTRGLINAEMFELMRPGSILLNTSRGEVVDADALLAAIETRGIRAGLDVYPDEPGSGVGEFQSALARHDQVVGTHHIGASTNQAQQAIAAGVVDVIRAYVQGSVSDCVNMEVAPLGRAQISVRHYDRVGVLASIFEVFRRADLNIEQMENKIFAGSHAAVALIEVGGDVSADVEDELRRLQNVIQVVVHRRS